MSRRWLLRSLTLVPALACVTALGILWRVSADPGDLNPAPQNGPRSESPQQPAPPSAKPAEAPAAKPTTQSDSQEAGPSMYA